MVLQLEPRETQESFRPVDKRPTETLPAVAATHRRRTLHLKKSRAHPARARAQTARELECVGNVRDSLSGLAGFNSLECAALSALCSAATCRSQYSPGFRQPTATSGWTKKKVLTRQRTQKSCSNSHTRCCRSRIPDTHTLLVINQYLVKDFPPAMHLSSPQDAKLLLLTGGIFGVAILMPGQALRNKEIERIDMKRRKSVGSGAEKRQMVIINRPFVSPQQRCDRCTEPSGMITPDEAAEGTLLICLSSLAATNISLRVRH